MPTSCLPVATPVSIVAEITVAITTSVIDVIVAVTVAPVASEDVCESRITIGSTTIHTTVTRIMTVNELFALLIGM